MSMTAQEVFDYYVGHPDLGEDFIKSVCADLTDIWKNSTSERCAVSAASAELLIRTLCARLMELSRAEATTGETPAQDGK